MNNKQPPVEPSNVDELDRSLSYISAHIYRLTNAEIEANLKWLVGETRTLLKRLESAQTLAESLSETIANMDGEYADMEGKLEAAEARDVVTTEYIDGWIGRANKAEATIKAIDELKVLTPNAVHCVGGNRKVVRHDSIQWLIEEHKKNC